MPQDLCTALSSTSNTKFPFPSYFTYCTDFVSKISSSKKPFLTSQTSQIFLSNDPCTSLQSLIVGINYKFDYMFIWKASLSPTVLLTTMITIPSIVASTQWICNKCIAWMSKGMKLKRVQVFHLSFLLCLLWIGSLSWPKPMSAYLDQLLPCSYTTYDLGKAIVNYNKTQAGPTVLVSRSAPEP